MFFRTKHPFFLGASRPFYFSPGLEITGLFLSGSVSGSKRLSICPVCNIPIIFARFENFAEFCLPGLKNHRFFLPGLKNTLDSVCLV